MYVCVSMAGMDDSMMWALPCVPTGRGKGHKASPGASLPGACTIPPPQPLRQAPGGSLEDHGPVVVHDDTVLQVPAHRLGQHSALQVAALAKGAGAQGHFGAASERPLLAVLHTPCAAKRAFTANNAQLRQEVLGPVCEEALPRAEARLDGGPCGGRTGPGSAPPCEPCRGRCRGGSRVSHPGR